MKTTDNRPKVKKLKLDLSLRDTNLVNSDSDTDDPDPEGDGLPDPIHDRHPEVVKVYEEDEEGNQIENVKKAYTLIPVPERIGCLINADDKFYNKHAIK